MDLNELVVESKGLKSLLFFFGVANHHHWALGLDERASRQSDHRLGMDTLSLLNLFGNRWWIGTNRIANRNDDPFWLAHQDPIGLAAELDISHQALSERLRRANKVLASEQVGEPGQDGIAH